MGAKPKLELTVTPLEIPARVVTAIVPEFIRLPKNGEQCPYSGLTRSFINSVILATPSNSFKPPVQSFVIRKKGARTGVRLVSYESLRQYILQHAEGAET